MDRNYRNLWGVMWRYKNKLDGKMEYLVYNAGRPVLFSTRKEAREYIDEKYGYIRQRPDLKSEPHGWKMPIPVPVDVVVTLKENKPCK
jgi:hypothetical protein